MPHRSVAPVEAAAVRVQLMQSTPELVARVNNRVAAVVVVEHGGALCPGLVQQALVVTAATAS